VSATEASNIDVNTTAATIRDDARSWLEQHWDPDLSVDDWWRIVAKAGWTAPHFTAEQGGRGLPRSAGLAVRAAFAEFGALRPPAVSVC
jgi:alkylation response protein AidB-like acyl-CoA dehydrogenase